MKTRLGKTYLAPCTEILFIGAYLMFDYSAILEHAPQRRAVSNV